jgi:hypothetical protein
MKNQKPPGTKLSGFVGIDRTSTVCPGAANQRTSILIDVLDCQRQGVSPCCSRGLRVRLLPPGRRYRGPARQPILP